MEQESSKVELPITSNKRLDFESPTLTFIPNSRAIFLQNCSYSFLTRLPTISMKESLKVPRNY